MPQGSRMKSYSRVRQPTGSFSASHSRCIGPPPREIGSGDGSSTCTPSSARDRLRSSLPSCRAPSSETASIGSPITVRVRSPPVNTTVHA